MIGCLGLLLVLQVTPAGAGADPTHTELARADRLVHESDARLRAARYTDAAKRASAALALPKDD